MISDIKANLKLGSPLEKATKEGVRSRIRPVIMTAAMAAMHQDLLPIQGRHPFLWQASGQVQMPLWIRKK